MGFCKHQNEPSGSIKCGEGLGRQTPIRLLYTVILSIDSTAILCKINLKDLKEDILVSREALPKNLPKGTAETHKNLEQVPSCTGLVHLC